jgi:hypothetical protein
MKGGTIIQQIGQELFVKVKNDEGSQINNGQVVYISGRTGVFPDVKLARSDVDATACVLGVATEDILWTGDKFGFVTTMGYVREIKTDYTGDGDWGTTWVAGDRLYLSKTVAGQLTNVEPAIPHHSDIVATVGIIHATQGSILVNINRHKSLEELTDINGTPLATTGQFPMWNNTAKYFDFNKNFLTDSLQIDQTTPQTIVNGQPIQDTLTASEIVATDANKKLQSLAVATYPSLAELAYVKGVTSAIQTQIGSMITKATLDADSVLTATSDDTPVATTMAEQTVLGRLTGGHPDDIAIGIADNNMVQVDDATVADNDYAKFTATGLEGRSYSEVLSDIGAAPTASPTFTGTVGMPDVQLAENAGIYYDALLSDDGKYSGFVENGTAGATLAFGDLCYLDPTDSRWELADANSAKGADGDARGTLGICVLAADADGSATKMLLQGKVRAATFPAFTVNDKLFVSETAGDITHTAPATTDAVVRVVGKALTAEDLFFSPSEDYATYLE